MCNNCNGGGLLNALFGRPNCCGCNQCGNSRGGCNQNNNCGCYDAYYAAQYALNRCGCNNSGCGNCNSCGGYTTASVYNQNGTNSGYVVSSVSAYGGCGCNNSGCGSSFGSYPPCGCNG